MNLVLKGESTGNYERRVQNALASLYANAPIFPAAGEQKLPALDFVAQTFSLATQEMLRDPNKAAVFSKLAYTAEAAANAAAAGHYDRAKHASRDVAFELLHRFGPSLVDRAGADQIGRYRRGSLETRTGRCERGRIFPLGAAKRERARALRPHSLRHQRPDESLII